MKKIHEILGIDPESWELLPKKEKIDKIIIAIEREADSFDFKLWNKNFTVWINSNVSVLIKKLKNDDTIDAKKIHFFRDWSNIAEGAMKANLVRYDDNNPNYSWKFKIKESLKVFDSLYILYKEWFDLIISGDDKNLLIQIEQRDREELFLNISKKTSSHISDEVWKRLKEKLILKISRKAKETTGRSIDDYVKKVFNDEIKKSLENKTMSGAALKVLDYDYLKYKEIFEFDDENEFTEIKQKMIENLENILFLGLSSDTAKEEEEMNEGIGGGKEKEIETEKGKEPKEEVENEKGSDLRVEELEKLLKEKDEEVEKLKKEARLFLERFSGQAGQGISRPKIVTFNKKPELLSAEQKYKIVESENIFKLEQEIKEFEQKISEYDDLLSVLLREQVLWKADKEKIKELKVETSHLKEIVKQLKKEKTDYFSHFFEIYLKYLAEVDGKPMNTKKKFEYFKKASSSLHQNQEQLQKLVLSDQISHLQNQKTFLIKKSVELAGYKTQAENLQAHLDLAHQDIETLTGQNTYYQDQDTKLRVTIKDLQDQINNHTCSGCHNSTHSDYDQLKTEKENLTTEKTTLQNENTNLTQTLKNLATNLGQQKNKTRNLTKFKKMLSEAIQDYKKELKSNKDQFRDFQFEIKSLKQDKSDLNDKIERFRDLKKDLYAQIREIKNNQKEQKQELTALKKESEEQQKTIQQLETEKQNWQQREQQLLVEIELLKNPPLTNTNKENLKQSVIVKEIIKEVIIKDLKNDELGLKISPQEEIKLNSLSLQEAESYRNQLIKNKFNHLENQIGKWEREREQSPSVFPRTERGENPSLNADYSIIYSDWWDGIVN